MSSSARWVRAGAVYAAWCERVVMRLPGRLRHRVAPSLVGFAVINATTFLVDISIVTLVHGAIGLSLLVAVTIGYGTALSLGFLLNRALNFRSHGDVRHQTGRYLVVISTNFVVLLLGVTALLSAAGVPYQVSRLIAGLCEAAFMYVAMRWFVFRPGPGARLA